MWPCAFHRSAEAGQFAKTQWDVVLAAGLEDPARSAEAKATLCQVYWYPLYAFVRHQGYTSEDAADLTQAFFEHILEHNLLAKVDRRKGKFRSFLLASLRHFLANARVRAQAQRRGGGRSCASLDVAAAERRYALEPADRNSPDKIFERNWALALMEHVLRQLRTEQETAGKSLLFQGLQDSLMGDPDAPAYARLSLQLGMSEEALKKTVSRLRQRYRELLHREIAHTVSDSAEVEEEIHHLFLVLGQ
jgi:DNA-directed RNA polymerase specialized sigma24 family protein